MPEGNPIYARPLGPEENIYQANPHRVQHVGPFTTKKLNVLTQPNWLGENDATQVGFQLEDVDEVPDVSPIEEIVPGNESVYLEERLKFLTMRRDAINKNIRGLRAQIKAVKKREDSEAR